MHRFNGGVVKSNSLCLSSLYGASTNYASPRNQVGEFQRGFADLASGSLRRRDYQVLRLIKGFEQSIIGMAVDVYLAK
jgi:hypothetical protein